MMTSNLLWSCCSLRCPEVRTSSGNQRLPQASTGINIARWYSSEPGSVRPRVNPAVAGHRADMESSEQQPGATQSAVRDDRPAPTVAVDLAGDTAELTVAGELTDAARRPLVREVTDLLLAQPTLHRIHLDLRGITFVNSAGVAVLVQLQKLAAPRAIDLVLVAPPAVVARPLQLTGLWHRFTIEESETGAG